MNIGLERPIGLEAGHTYHIRLVVDDTIGTLYVDGVALNVRMYVRASRWASSPPTARSRCATPSSPAD